MANTQQLINFYPGGGGGIKKSLSQKSIAKNLVMYGIYFPWVVPKIKASIFLYIWFVLVGMLSFECSVGFV